MKKIDIVKALLEDEGGASDVCVRDGGIKIAVLQRGWVFVGRFSQNGSQCKLTDAYNVQTWGTTRGLGEIAEEGPTSKTVLHKINDVGFHELGVVATIDCNAKVWEKKL